MSSSCCAVPARRDVAAILMSASRLRVALDLLEETTGAVHQRAEVEVLRDDANPMLAMAPSMVHGPVRRVLARVNVISVGRFRR
jgi:hypothetical protein